MQPKKKSNNQSLKSGIAVLPGDDRVASDLLFEGALLCCIGQFEGVNLLAAE